MIKEIDDRITLITDNVTHHQIQDEVIISIPTINQEKALVTARLLLKRAFHQARVLIFLDSERIGWVGVTNHLYKISRGRFFVYLADDAYPCRGWLKLALADHYKSEKALIGFNDGKWHGRLATFGMLERRWVDEQLKGIPLHGGYVSHCADDELTVVARANSAYLYSTASVVVEVDYEKDFHPKYSPDDRKLFIDRFVKGFDGTCSTKALVTMASDYGFRVKATP